MGEITDQDIFDLQAQLNEIHISRETKLSELRRLNDAETEVTKALDIARKRRTGRKEKGKNRGSNPYRIGDWLQINNDLRDEKGIVGQVVNISKGNKTFIRIEDPVTKSEYTRAWWSYIPVETTTPNDEEEEPRAIRSSNISFEE